MITRNMLLNFPVTVGDINNPVKRFVPEIHDLQGKTTIIITILAKKSLIKVPERILKLYHLITSAIEIFFVNNLPFLQQCHDT